MFSFSKSFSLSAAIYFCLAAAACSVAAAFIGDKAAGSFMSQPFALAAIALLALALAFVGCRAAFRRRRYSSALLHVGFACILAGWLIGQYAEHHATADRPAVGSMALVDGDTSDTLFTGERLQTFAGRVPFTLTLNHFSVSRYGGDTASDTDRPVREYSSQVTLRQDGEPSRTANIRVNHPAHIAGYYIYQMSWGTTQDEFGRPITYTILSFIRDPGLRVVYAGFILLALGAFLFALRQFFPTPPVPSFSTPNS